MNDGPEHPEGVTSWLADNQAAHLLDLAHGGGVRPIDAVLDRLTGPGGQAWLSDALQRLGGDVRTRLVDGGPVESFAALKEQAKVLGNRGCESALAGRLGYFLTIAAALAHHNRLISSRSGGDIQPILVELGPHLDPELEAVVARAVQALADSE